MSEHERQEFLAGVHVGVISIERADGPPLTVPIWYGYEPGGLVWIITGAESLKGRLLNAARRFSLCAQTEEPPFYKSVSVEGPIVDVAPVELVRAAEAAHLERVFADTLAAHGLVELRGELFAAQHTDDQRLGGRSEAVRRPLGEVREVVDEDGLDLLLGRRRARGTRNRAVNQHGAQQREPGGAEHLQRRQASLPNTLRSTSARVGDGKPYSGCWSSSRLRPTTDSSRLGETCQATRASISR